MKILIGYFSHISDTFGQGVGIRCIGEMSFDTFDKVKNDRVNWFLETSYALTSQPF